MQNIPRKALCLIATFLLSGSLHADQSVAFSSGYDPCAVVDAFQRLHDDADGSFPDHFGAYEAKRDGTEFDVNLYFTVLKHLSPPEGYVLDYVYFRCLGGMPVLYWRKQNAARFSTYGEYDKNAGGYDKIIEQENRLSSRLVLDGTPLPDNEVILSPERPHVFSFNGVSYRGKLQLIVNPTGHGFDAINVVPLEPYLAGVVGEEMPDYWEPEALKAQAVAARTYCLYIRSRFGTTRNWDVSRTQANQVYGGIQAESSPVWTATARRISATASCLPLSTRPSTGRARAPSGR